MSTSDKQLQANRENALKSTGPKTEEGKKTSSRNAITHGLHATDIVINSPHLKEDQSLYDGLVESLFDELKPVGVLQEHLVMKITNCLWRYRRSINAESATINKQLKSPLFAPIPPHFLPEGTNPSDHAEEHSYQMQSRTIPVGDPGLNLLRYEWRLDRELYRTYRLLNFLQLKAASDSTLNLLSEEIKK